VELNVNSETGIVLATSVCVDLDVSCSNIMYCYSVWDTASSHVAVQWTEMSPNTSHAGVK